MSERLHLTPEDYEIAERNGINRATAIRRFYHSNWSRERTITEKPRAVGKYGEWLEIAKENGIRVNTFYTRKRRGYSDKDAATKPLQLNQYK